jgi:ABC-type lipoprotein release transport system permease subunit
VSTLLGWAVDRVGWYAHGEQLERCFAFPEPLTLDDNCSVSYHVTTLPIYLKWVAGFKLLAATMPLYLIACWIRSRRIGEVRPNTSFERTRDE